MSKPRITTRHDCGEPRLAIDLLDRFYRRRYPQPESNLYRSSVQIGGEWYVWVYAEEERGAARRWRRCRSWRRTRN